MPEIIVSILNLDFLNLTESFRKLKMAGVKHIHLDVIDTSFANNISFGPDTINQILQFDFEFDLHLMIENPMNIIKLFNLNKIKKIAVHNQYEEIKKELKDYHHIKIGLAVDLKEQLPDINPDYFLIMSVKAGYGKQRFQQISLEKIIKAKSRGVEVVVDGGIDSSNIHLFKEVNFVVVGSAITQQANIEEAFKILKNLSL